MSSSSNTNWRARLVEKDRLQKETADRKAEAERLKPAAMNEQNFPTTMTSSARPVAALGFARKAAEAEQREIAERAAEDYRKQKAATRELPPDVFVYRARKKEEKREEYDYDEEEEEDTPRQVNRILDFTAAGPRGTSTAPDGEGWATVTRRKHTKRELTHAELDRMARSDLPDDDDGDWDNMNGDLGDTSHRRQFY